MLAIGFSSLIIFWVMYAKVLAGVNKISYARALRIDAVSYAPFLAFAAYPLAHLIAVKNYQIHYVYYFLRALIFTFALASCVLIKAISLRVKLDSFRLPFKPFYIVLGMMATFLMTMLAINFTQHNSLGYRLHSCLNIMANIAAGRFSFTLNDFGFRAGIFNHHLQPIYLFITIFFKLLGGSPYALIFIQTLTVSLGVLPIYQASSKRLGGVAGIAFSLSYLLSSPLWISNLWGFTGHAFAVPFLCFFLYYVTERRYFPMMCFAILTLFCGEFMAPIIFMFGIYLILADKKMAVGLSLVILAAAYAFAAIKISVLSLSGTYSHQKAASMLTSMVQNPEFIMQFFKQLHPKKIASVFLLLFQTGYLGIFAPLFLISMVAGIFMNFLGPWGSDIKSSYVWAPLVPIAIFSAILGASNLIKTDVLKRNKNGQVALYLYVFVSVIAGYLFFNPFKIYTLDKSGDRFFVEYRDIKIRQALKKIPLDASVACTFNISSQLAAREDISFVPGIPIDRPRLKKFNYPFTQDAEYVVIDIYDDFFDLGAQNPVVQEILRYPAYSVLDFVHGVIILKKGSGPDFYEFVKADGGQQIQYKKNVLFENKIAFLGYNVTGLPARPGSTIAFTYFWKPLVDLNEDYLVMTNLCRTYDTKTFQYLHEPLYGIWPTSRWKAGDVIKDEFTIQLPRDIVITERPFVVEVYILKKLPADTDRIIKKRYLKKEIGRWGPNIIGELYIEPDL